MSAADGMIARERSVGADAFEGLGQYAGERCDVATQASDAAVEAVEAKDQGSSDLLQGVGAIDLPGGLLVGWQLLMCLMANGLDDIVQQHFGLNFLLDGPRQLTAKAFDMLTLLDELEPFLDAPTAAIEFAKAVGRETLRVHQRGRQHVILPVG